MINCVVDYRQMCLANWDNVADRLGQKSFVQFAELFEQGLYYSAWCVYVNTQKAVKLPRRAVGADYHIEKFKKEKNIK
jgi:hypothetical protein